MLSAAGGQQVSEALIRKDMAAGAPTNPDGTLNLVHYAAWLVREGERWRLTRARLRPSELCRLLNSTPLGEVITERQLKRHRNRAGLRIGDGKHVDLVRYVAWLVQQRHAREGGAGDERQRSD